MANTEWDFTHADGLYTVITFGETDYSSTGGGKGTYAVSGNKVTIYREDGKVREWELKGNKLITDDANKTVFTKKK